MQNQHQLEFGLTVSQGWRGGDLPLEEDNDPLSKNSLMNLIGCTPYHPSPNSIKFSFTHFIYLPSNSLNSIVYLFVCFLSTSLPQKIQLVAFDALR
jgi:hypothetical protein